MIGILHFIALHFADGAFFFFFFFRQIEGLRQSYTKQVSQSRFPNSICSLRVYVTFR